MSEDDLRRAEIKRIMGEFSLFGLDWLELSARTMMEQHRKNLIIEDWQRQLFAITCHELGSSGE